MHFTIEQQKLLDKILSKVGDLNFKRRIMQMLEYLEIQDGDHILDMGCGEGFYALIFDKLYNCKVTAVDYDEHIMGMAKEWLKESKKVTFEIGDICNLRFKDNTFDKIVCTEVLEHIVDHEKATSELYRVLKPKGVLATTVPNHNYPFVWDPLNKIRENLGLGHFDPKNGFLGGIWAYDHKRLYYPNEFKKLLTDNKFEVQDLKVMTHYGVPFNHLVLYGGKYLYTMMPVSDEIKNAMEKFKWDDDANSQVVKQGLASKIINNGFAFLKWVDSFNDREFNLDTSAMVVAAKAVKK